MEKNARGVCLEFGYRERRFKGKFVWYLNTLAFLVHHTGQKTPDDRGLLFELRRILN